MLRTQGTEINFNLSATDDKFTIYSLTGTTNSNRTYSVTLSAENVELNAELRQVKGDGWSYNSGIKKLSITSDISDFTSGGADWYIWCNDIEKIEITSGVTKIPNYAFQDCGNIPSITNNATLTSIGDNAFQNMPKFILADDITETCGSIFVGQTYYVKPNTNVTLNFQNYSGNVVSIKDIQNTGVQGNNTAKNKLTFTMSDTDIELENIDILTASEIRASGSQEKLSIGEHSCKSLTFELTEDIDLSGKTDFRIGNNLFKIST